MEDGVYLGVDVGSVSTNLVVMEPNGQIINKIYLRTEGNPIGSVQKAFREVAPDFTDVKVLGGWGDRFGSEVNWGDYRGRRDQKRDYRPWCSGFTR